MRKYIFLLFATLLFACSEETQQEDDTLLLPQIGYSYSDADKACLMQAETAICELGLPFAILGQSMVELTSPNAETEMSDGVQEGGGFYWNTKTFHTPSGDIIAEGDFIDAREEDAGAKPEYNRINRIRIEAEGYETTHGMHVGSDLGELLQVVGPDMLSAQYLPDYQSIQVAVTGSRLLYVIRDENGQFEDFETGAEVPLEEIPDGISIYAIVMLRDF